MNAISKYNIKRFCTGHAFFIRKHRHGGFSAEKTLQRGKTTHKEDKILRIITMLTGALFMGGGIYLLANGGITFMSVAFPVGILFVIGGIVECLSYNSYRGDEEDRTWILIDGMTTFLLGGLILLNKLSADTVVPMVLGLWVITTGVRNFVTAWEDIENRDRKFYDHMAIGLLNLITGIYVFFDVDIFNLATITMVGLCIVVQGFNIFHIGATIIILKPNFIKTKQEILEEAAAKAEEAHVAAKEAIKAAKEAKAEVRVIEATPEELLDAVLAPKPGTENTEPAGGTDSAAAAEASAEANKTAEE